jgi:folate-binding protein YgfZ
VTADVRVAVETDVLLLDVDVRARQGLVEALEQLIIADDVELREAPEPTALLGLEGPRAAGLLGGAATTLAPYAHALVTVAGVPLRAQRASEVRGPGFVLHVPAAAATNVWDALRDAGARPCGMEALEGRRVEIGVPRIGLDMDGSTLALEVPVEDAISTSKGCYLGQEVVARGTARGHVNRRLVGLLIDGPAAPAGSPLVREGKEVGRLTSVAQAFGRGAPAALGFVRREHWEPDTSLAVKHGHAVTIARVTPFPLA